MKLLVDPLEPCDQHHEPVIKDQSGKNKLFRCQSEKMLKKCAEVKEFARERERERERERDTLRNVRGPWVLSSPASAPSTRNLTAGAAVKSF